MSPRPGGGSAKAGNLLQQLPSAPVYKFSIVSAATLLCCCCVSHHKSHVCSQTPALLPKSCSVSSVTYDYMKKILGCHACPWLACPFQISPCMSEVHPCCRTQSIFGRVCLA